MSSINIPDVSVNLVPEQSVGDLTRPRALVVGTIPASKNAIFGADTSKFLQVSQQVSFEQMDDSDIAEMVGTGSLYHRIVMAKKGSNKLVPIDLLLVKNNRNRYHHNHICGGGNNAQHHYRARFQWLLLFSRC